MNYSTEYNTGAISMTVLIIVVLLVVGVPALINSDWWLQLEMKLRHDHYWKNEQDWKKKNDKQ